MSLYNLSSIPTRRWLGIFNITGDQQHTLAFGETAASLLARGNSLGEDSATDFSFGVGDFQPVNAWVLGWSMRVNALTSISTSVPLENIALKIGPRLQVGGGVSAQSPFTIIPMMSGIGAVDYVVEGNFRVEALVASLIVEHISSTLGSIMFTWDVWAKAES